ncbi:MAG TPA: hypothetical protein VGL62_16540 [Vicinamibacterales bacterium]|jgi:hypothetical protein
MPATKSTPPGTLPPETTGAPRGATPGQPSRTLSRLGLLNRADLALDGAILARLPFGSSIAATAVAVAAASAAAFFARGSMHVFTESLPCVIAALALGLLVPSWGVLIVIGDLVGEGAMLFVHARSLDGRTLAIVGGRAVVVWLLWLLCARVPLMSRAAGRQMLASRMRWGATRAIACLVMTSAAAALFAFIWTEALPTLIRPAFVWIGVMPPADATAIVQADARVIVATAAIVGAIAGLLLLASPSIEPARLPVRRGTTLARATWRCGVRPIILTVAMGGLITSWTQAAVIYACFLVLPIVGVIARRRLGIAHLLSRVPLPARVAVASVVAFGLASGLEFGALWFHRVGVPSLAPGLIAGLFAFGVLSPASVRTTVRPTVPRT